MSSTVYDKVIYIPEQIQTFRENTFAENTDFGFQISSVDKQFAWMARMTHAFLSLHAPIEDIVAKFGQGWLACLNVFAMCNNKIDAASA